MARYTVHVPTKFATREAALERAVFVRDGWSWPAFAFGPLWLLWHRHIAVGLVLLVLSVGAGIGFRLLPMPEWAAGGVSFALMALFGLEGSSLRRLALGLSGHLEEGIVVGEDRDGLERRFFENAFPSRPAPEAREPVRAPMGLASASAPVLGLFPDPRKHP